MQTVTESDRSTEQRRAEPPLRIKYRVRFAKTGLLRWISHRDLARLWERLVRRAQLQLSMTEGFHPKPRISFPSALALGVEGLNEVVELDLAEQLQAGDLLERLRRDEQPGLQILSVVRLPDGFGKAQLLRSDYLIAIPQNVDLDRLQTAIEQLKIQTAVPLVRKKKTTTVDVATQVLRLEVSQQQLQLSIAASDAASLRPGEVLELIGAGNWIEDGATITRTRVLLQKEYPTEDLAKPMFQTNTTGDSHEQSPS